MKAHSTRSTFRRILNTLSLGKYQSKLYHRGLSEHSSLVSGLLTILCILFLGFFIFNAFYDVLRLANYSIVQRAHLTKNYLKGEIRVGEVSQMFEIDIFVDVDSQKSQKRCTNLTLMVHSI